MGGRLDERSLVIIITIRSRSAADRRKNVPYPETGDVHGEPLNPTFVITFPVTPDQVSRINEYIRTHRAMPYTVLWHDCMDWTQDALKAGGVRGTAPVHFVRPESTILWNLLFTPGAHVTQSPPPGTLFQGADNAVRRALLTGGFGR
jgi:hypothetical protein